MAAYGFNDDKSKVSLDGLGNMGEAKYLTFSYKTTKANYEGSQSVSVGSDICAGLNDDDVLIFNMGVSQNSDLSAHVVARWADIKARTLSANMIKKFGSQESDTDYVLNTFSLSYRSNYQDINISNTGSYISKKSSVTRQFSTFVYVYRLKVNEDRDA